MRAAKKDRLDIVQQWVNQGQDLIDVVFVAKNAHGNTRAALMTAIYEEQIKKPMPSGRGFFNLWVIVNPYLQ